MDDQFDNRELIIEYLESGCKGGDMGYIGVEIEQFVLDEDGDRVPYIEKHGRLGVRDILEQLSPYYPEVVRNEEGDILSVPPRFQRHHRARGATRALHLAHALAG